MSETTTVEPSDQLPLVSVDVGKGGLANVPLAQAEALLPAGSAPLYQFAAEWHGPFNGQLLSFRAGYSYQLDPALRTFLTAQGANITEL